MVLQKYVLFTILLVSLFLLSCTPAMEVSEELRCQTDADCVPAQCCHPTSAVNKDFAPDCAGILCSQNCEPNTLDCGQGEIKCQAGKCKAIITE